MIKYSNYNKIERADPKGNQNYIDTTLIVTLSFNEEVLKKDFKDIKERLDWRKDPLKNYLNSRKFSLLTSLSNNKEYFSNNAGRRLTFKKNTKKLELKVKVTSNKNLLEEKMIDLEKLNHFILTGRIMIPEK